MSFKATNAFVGRHKLCKALEQGFVFISAVDEVSQGHLLVAGEFVPHSSAGDEVEVERRGQEVSNQLTAHGLVHGKRILKFDIERLVCILSSLCSERVYTFQQCW